MKKIIKLFLCIVLMLVAVYFIHYHYKYQVVDDYDNKGLGISKDNMEELSDLKEEYNNNEIVMSIDIPGVLALPIVQTSDNDYYLTHDLSRKESDVGTPFLDYRIKSFNDKKIVVYGYNDVDSSLPFSSLTNYKDESFYKEHSIILTSSNEGKRKYKIFSCFVEEKGFNYEILNVYNSTKYEEQIKTLKEKSSYDTSVDVSDEDRIIVLLTGTLNESKDSLKYQFVIGKEVKDSIE